jgi:hypothetical protein
MQSQVTPAPAAETVEQAALPLVVPAPIAEAVDQADLPLVVPAPTAEAVEQSALPLVMSAPADDDVEQQASLDPTVAPEPARAVTAAVPDLLDAPHWAMATYDEGMTVDDASGESSVETAPVRSASAAESAAAVTLESVAARLRRGEILLAAGSSASNTDAAVLAAVLSALLRTHR